MGGGLGPEHPDVAAILENCSVLLRKTNRETHAREFEARARDKSRQELSQSLAASPSFPFVINGCVCHVLATCSTHMEAQSGEMKGVLPNEPRRTRLHFR